MSWWCPPLILHARRRDKITSASAVQAQQGKPRARTHGQRSHTDRLTQHSTSLAAFRDAFSRVAGARWGTKANTAAAGSRTGTASPPLLVLVIASQKVVRLSGDQAPDTASICSWALLLPVLRMQRNPTQSKGKEKLNASGLVQFISSIVR